MKFTILVTLIGLSTCVMLIKENVIFNKVSEITLTRSKWQVIFFIETSPFQRFLSKIGKDIYFAKKSIGHVVKYYNNKSDIFRGAFRNLQKEIIHLHNSKHKLENTYGEYNLLRHRSRRSLIPVIGSALKFLFGVETEVDVSTINKNIQILRQNQIKVTHVLEKSMSILNTSRLEIMKNRHKINEIITKIARFEKSLQSIANEFLQDILNLENFLKLYLQLDIILREIGRTLNQAMLYFERFNLQLSSLSSGKISPAIISPHDLSNILKMIQSKLPEITKLPHNIDKNLWAYYKLLTCETIIEHQHILIILTVPLLDYNGKFNIYELHNFPFPLATSKTNSKTMIAKYQIQSSALAINDDRSSYFTLNSLELNSCTKTHGFCEINSPVYPVNLAKLCILALFLNHDTSIQETCKTIITPNFQMPNAQYIADGNWVIVSFEKLSFSVVCQHGGRRHTIETQSSVSFIKLNKTCKASNSFLSLVPYYKSQSWSNVTDSAGYLLKSFNVSSVKIWEPFHSSLPKFNLTSDLPEKLKNVQEIPMNDFIETLHNLNDIVPENVTPHWTYGVTSVPFIILIGLIIYCIWQYKCNKNKSDSAINVEKDQQSITVQTPEPKLVVVTGSTNAPSTNREFISTPTISEEGSEPNKQSNYIRSLYPQIDNKRDSEVAN